MGILDGNQKKEPLHYGEISAMWMFSAKAKLAFSGYHTLLNHAGDADLKNLMKDHIDLSAKEMEECDALLIKNDIVPPPSLPEKPKANLEEIPVGARFTDQEIAATLGADLAAGLTSCSGIIAQVTREDIGALFAKYHQSKTTLSGRLLRLTKEKGWLVPPPLQLHTQELVHA